MLTHRQVAIEENFRLYLGNSTQKVKATAKQLVELQAVLQLIVEFEGEYFNRQ
jgi:hypothetical protein